MAVFAGIGDSGGGGIMFGSGVEGWCDAVDGGNVMLVDDDGLMCGCGEGAGAKVGAEIQRKYSIKPIHLKNH